VFNNQQTKENRQFFISYQQIKYPKQSEVYF